MPRIFATLLFLNLFLSACAPGRLSPVPSQQAASQTEDVVSPSTPHIEQGSNGASTVSPSYPEGCGYQWAYQDLPELSSNFLQSIQQLQPEAQASAYAFGENCIGQDGTTVKRFIPMETDFNITLQVSDLSNESDLGEWIVKVMEVIESIPPAQIIGPRPGRVSMGFQSNGEQRVVAFYIDEYRALPLGLSTAEIYQALQIPQ